MIKFLRKDTILAFHQDQLERYGGKAGIRDEELLESALAQPEASFGGEYVHKEREIEVFHCLHNGSAFRTLLAIHRAANVHIIDVVAAGFLALIRQDSSLGARVGVGLLIKCKSLAFSFISR